MQRLIHAVQKEKDDGLKVSLTVRTQRAIDLACDKGDSSWLTAIPLKDMNLDQSRQEFCDTLRLCCDWPIPYTPNANMADHSVSARDEYESEASEALVFCFDNASSEKSYFMDGLVCFISLCLCVFEFLNATRRE